MPGPHPGSLELHSEESAPQWQLLEATLSAVAVELPAHETVLSQHDECECRGTCTLVYNMCVLVDGIRMSGQVDNTMAISAEVWEERESIMPFGCETTGGLGPSAVQLIRVMAQASAELLHMWSYGDIVRELVGSVAIAVQRGGAMAYLEGYDRDGARGACKEGGGLGTGDGS